MRLFGALSLSLIAAVLVMSALIVAGPGAVSDRLIWSGLLFPVLWTSFIFYVYWPERALQPIAVLSLASIASVALVALA